VRAHVAVCVLAYGMLRAVERLADKAELGMSGEQALGKLGQVTVEQANLGGLKLRVRRDLTVEQKSIFEALRAPPPPWVKPLVANTSPPSSQNSDHNSLVVSDLPQTVKAGPENAEKAILGLRAQPVASGFIPDERSSDTRSDATRPPGCENNGAGLARPAIRPCSEVLP